MQKTDVVVIGAGPAGLAAAIEVARAGGKVVLIDENEKPGGQLFKQIHKFFGSKEHLAGVRGGEIGEMLLEETHKLGVEVLLHAPVYALFSDNIVMYSSHGTQQGIQAQNDYRHRSRKKARMFRAATNQGTL